MRRGATLAGRYHLVESIGAGGMGEVWRATDEILGRTVAVKVIKPGLHADPEFGRRFLAEARALASVHHPGVVAIHDFGETELPDASGTPGGGKVAFLVMEYVAGESLSARLRRDGRLSPATTMDLVSQTAQALQAVHEHGIVHRDVKPANLIIRPSGAIALTDFGIATNPNATALTKPGMILGTPSYLAPEQVLGKPVSPLTDVFALGVVAYECLAGQKPFVAEDPIAAAVQRVHGEAPPLPADVPPHVARVVTRAMATEPAQRWQTAEEFALAAGAAITGTGALLAHQAEPAAEADPVHPLPLGRGRRLHATPTSRRRWLPAVSGAIAVILIAAGAAVLWGNRDRGSADASTPGGAGTASAGPAGTASVGPTSPTGVGPSGGTAVPGAPTGGAGRNSATPTNPGSKTTAPSGSATPYPRTRGSNGSETVGVRMTPSSGSNSPMPDLRLQTNIIEAASEPWAYISMDYHQSPHFQSPTGYLTWTYELYTCSGSKVKESTSSQQMDFVRGTQLSVEVASYHGPHYLTAKLTSLDVGLTSVPSMLMVNWTGTPITATTPCTTIP